MHVLVLRYRCELMPSLILLRQRRAIAHCNAYIGINRAGVITPSPTIAVIPYFLLAAYYVGLIMGHYICDGFVYSRSRATDWPVIFESPVIKMVWIPSFWK